MSDNKVRTISDIARLAGVSKSTVSRALSDSPLVAEETKDRIRAIAREHRFHISEPARRLSMRRSRTVAFVTHAHYACFSWVDLFGLELLGGITRGLYECGYDTLILHVDPNDTRWAARYLETGRVDGFILHTSARKQYHVKALLDMEAPFIVWGFPHPGRSYCSVASDDVEGGRLATEHLIRSGRQRIAFLGGRQGEPEVKHRYAGYASALQGARREVDPLLVAYGDYSDTSGAETMRSLLTQAPELDSVFVNSDVMALAAMDAIREQGRRVPEDVAVVGYDDLSIAAHTNPPLTTVRQNVPEAGRILAKSLVEYLDTRVVTNVTVPVELVVRESS
ncbi:LacI family DNA-binding transcriptional regulator [Candidatus Bipolaricaulota bacterium]|nr:LacI family DNA-binding transcriptional regulator [Candidatus Bipolaricaulota bacterium]